MRNLIPAHPTSDDVIMLIVHVIPACEVEKLDEGDLDDHGNCLVDGSYKLALCLQPSDIPNIYVLAINAFHHLRPIYKIDDFRIVLSTFNPEIDRITRDDLGSWKFDA